MKQIVHERVIERKRLWTAVRMQDLGVTTRNAREFAMDSRTVKNSELNWASQPVTFVNLQWTLACGLALRHVDSKPMSFSIKNRWEHTFVGNNRGTSEKSWVAHETA